MFLCIASHVAVAQEVVINPKIDSEFNKRKSYYKKFGAQISNYYDIVSCIRTGEGKDSVALLTPYYTRVGYSGWYPDSVENDLLLVYDIQTKAVTIYENALLPSESFILTQKLKPTENGFVIQIHNGDQNPFDANIYVGGNAIDSIYIESKGPCQDANTYKFNNLYLNEFDVEMIFSLRNELCCHIEIIKDSVCVGGECWELQELTITQPHVYRTIQEVFPIFGDTLFFGTYKERLNYKKKMILDCNGSWDCLQKKGYVNELYTINYEKNGILNLMIQYFQGELMFEIGFPVYFTFDLKEDWNFGEDVFVNKETLTKKIYKKMKPQGSFIPSTVFDELFKEEYIDLSKYEIKTDSNGVIKFVFMYWYHRSLPLYAEFSFEEIKPFLKPEFLRRLTDE